MGDNLERDIKKLSHHYNDFLNSLCCVMVGQLILEALINEGITVTKIEKSISLQKHINQILERVDPKNFKMREIKRSCIL